MRYPIFTSLLALILASGSVAAREPVRIDSTTVASAEASWKEMSDSLRGSKKKQLHIAMLKLNMIGINSAYEVVDNPELQEIGIARVKDKVSGMTADQIIELADRTGTVTVERQAK